MVERIDKHFRVEYPEKETKQNNGRKNAQEATTNVIVCIFEQINTTKFSKKMYKRHTVKYDDNTYDDCHSVTLFLPLSFLSLSFCQDGSKSKHNKQKQMWYVRHLALEM